MPKVALPHQPELTPDRLADLVRQKMPELEVKPTKLPGADLLAGENPALGASLRIKQQPDKERTLIVVGGFVPNLALRVGLALVFILPLAILNLVGQVTLAPRIAKMLEQAPELHGGGEPSALSEGPERP